MKAKAINHVGALPGQKVVVESSTKKMLGIVSFVYANQVVLVVLGYLLMAFTTTSVPLQYGVAIAGFVIGIVLAVFYDRRIKRQGGLTFNIVRLF